ncbi:MAG: substrate-binding protein [Marmoricola sp.]|nr:substrate-binding protein [Marmoricola sp.]
MKHTSKIGVAGLSVTLALALAACSGNTDSTTSASPTSDATVSAGIVAKGEAAAKAAGGSTTLPSKTVGWVYYGANGIASQRSYNGLKAAADAIGWKTKACDGAGVPAKMQACASNLLNQGVDALIVNTIDTATMADAIKQSTAKGVPMISIGGSIETSKGYAASYAPDEAGMGSALGKYIADTLGSAGGGVIEQTFPAKFATLRTDAMEAAYAGTSVKVVNKFDADPVDLAAATQKQTAAGLNAHSDAKAVTMVFSTAEIGASQAIIAKYGAGKAFPQRPLLTTYYANLPVIKMIRDGQLDAAAENPLEWCGWVAIDQLAENFARKTPISTDERPSYGTDTDFWRPTVVTKDNLPAEGQLLAPAVDFAGFFTAKWDAEFKN